MSDARLAASQNQYDIAIAITLYTIYYQQEQTTNRAFYLRNLCGETQEAQVAHARQIVDQVAQEMYYLTGFGVDKGVVKVGSRQVAEIVYEGMKPRLENWWFKALQVKFSPVYKYVWKRGPKTAKYISNDELDQGWQREIEQAKDSGSFQLPMVALNYQHPMTENGYQSFFLFQYGLYRKRKRKPYGFSLKYDGDDLTLQRFLARFHEDGNLCFGDRRDFASKTSHVSLEGHDWPKSKAKPKPGPRRSALASRPTDETEFVYLIRAGRTHVYKIGKSNDPQGRLQSLQTSNPHKLKLLHTFKADNATAAEEELHRLLHGKRLEGEWFKLTPQEKDVLASVERFEGRQFWIEGQGLTGDELFG